MFDLFDGPIGRKVDESNQAHAANVLALCLVLIEKGIVTGEELANARQRVTAMVDQLWAERRDEAQREFDEKYPGVREFVDKMTGNSDG